MTTRHGGSRYRTRKTFRKNVKAHGKISITNYFQKLQEGDKVLLKVEPAVQKGMYHARFHGYPGIITGSSGSCYTVSISDKGKQKELIVHPVHLRKTM